MNLILLVLVALFLVISISNTTESFTDDIVACYPKTKQPTSQQPVRIPGGTLRMSGIDRYPHVSITHPQGLIKIIDSIPNETICASRCQSEPGCGAYTYQPKQQVCYLYHRPAPGVQFLQRTPTYYTGVLHRTEIVKPEM